MWYVILLHPLALTYRDFKWFPKSFGRFKSEDAAAEWATNTLACPWYTRGDMGKIPVNAEYEFS